MGSESDRFSGARRHLMERLFPEGIPRLWCPSLTHYAEDGTLDRARMRAHLKFMQPAVKGLLVPGSTGEGWEMSDAELGELVDFMLDEIRGGRTRLLVGVLKTDARDVVATVRRTMAALRRRTGAEDPVEALARSGACGFTICAPSGAGRSQQEIEAALEEVLSLDLPFALYQLPQVTQNEIAPGTVEALSGRHPGFYLFKDSSGGDRVARSGFRGAFLVRGAEGRYLEHCAGAGGEYDGFLLSTANGFGRQLGNMLAHVDRGEMKAAEAFSEKLTAICAQLFELAGRVGYGNAFTNANKAMDHFFAHGPGAGAVAAPLLHSGRRLPRELIEAAGAILASHDAMPRRGYLEGTP